MTARITTLIKKQDNFEKVRDKVAEILKEEEANQQALALAAGEDPSEWALRVFKERSNPWEFMRTDDGAVPTDRTPVVCVWYDSSNVDSRASQNTDRQQYNANINIDVYGIGVTEILPNSAGQVPGDRAAAIAAQQAAKLVRNIVMADSYTRLGFDAKLGIVGRRMITSIQTFQPDYGNNNAVHVAAVRLTLQVAISETAPQAQGEELESVGVTVTDNDGEVLINASYESSTP